MLSILWAGTKMGPLSLLNTKALPKSPGGSETLSFKGLIGISKALILGSRTGKGPL